ncbi:helix-turn-helix domain-containing protein [Aureivirga sp. CE67]|uniref:helix-turn-helix domain-containing protein n=1 Tax=Aureivirga sp. CE67 TaxID=1788983 RepID=UPI0018CA71C1|nr:helix-turn-helix domain-containing protein [Aureivirga sp. CE67]
MRNILMIISFFLGVNCFAQIDIEKILKKGYKDIGINYIIAELNDSIRRRYIDLYIYKAKKEKNPYRIVNGYKIGYDYSKDIFEGAPYLDSILAVKDNPKPYYFYYAYAQKAMLCRFKNDINKAIDYYIKSQNIAESLGDTLGVYKVKYEIATVKMNYHQKEEVVEDLIEIYNFCQKNRGKLYENLEKRTIGILTRVLLLLKKNDQAYGYMKYWQERHYAKANVYQKYFFLTNWGIYYHQKEYYKASIDSLAKGLKIHNEYFEHKADIHEIYYYLYLSKLKKNGLGNIKLLLKSDSLYMNKYDTILNQNRLKIYPLLIDFYKQKEDITKQILYTDRLIMLDSIYDAENNDVVNNIKKYDIEKIKKQKEDLEKEIEKVANQKILLVSIISISLLIFIYFLWKKKQKNQLKKEIDNSEGVVEESENNKEKSLSNDVIEDILSKLDKFEKSDSFIKKKYTLQILAKELDTNSTYLSKVINQKKGENFSNYINNLKISYITEILEKESKFRNYTIKALAEEAGFNTTQSFTKAFEKKNKKTIINYINQLVNEKD